MLGTHSSPKVGDPEVLVVLGMHRSGTSLLTGLLEQLGFYICSAPMPATSDNPKGYFENPLIVDIHDRILSELGISWDDPRPMPPYWYESTRVWPFVDQLTELARSEFQPYSRWAMKDPRVCRLLPVWREIFRRLSIVPRFLIIHRPAIEVAASLTRRDGFSEEKSLLLWMEHMLSAELMSRPFERAFLSYQNLLDDPVSTLQRCWRALELPTLRCSGRRQDGDRFIRRTGIAAPQRRGSWEAVRAAWWEIASVTARSRARAKWW